MKRTGFFLTFEGIDGTGKSTQMGKIAAWLTAEGYEVVCTREPGGTVVAERIRELVLDASLNMAQKTEVLLYLAARADHVANLLKPALAAGKIVLCDRYGDSTLVYQGAGRGVNIRDLLALEQFTTDGISPDLTFLLDAAPVSLLERRNKRGVSDKFELEGIAFQEKIRAAFLALVPEHPERIKVVNALRQEDEVTREIVQLLRNLLGKE